MDRLSQTLKVRIKNKTKCDFWLLSQFDCICQLECLKTTTTMKPVSQVEHDAHDYCKFPFLYSLWLCSDPLQKLPFLQNCKNLSPLFFLSYSLSISFVLCLKISESESHSQLIWNLQHRKTLKPTANKILIWSEFLWRFIYEMKAIKKNTL